MELSPIKMAWLGNLLGIPRPFELWNFHRNFIFWIIKCVPAYSEHVPAGSESSPAIDSSDMNQKTFRLLFLRWRQQALSRCRYGGTGVE